MSQIWSRNHLPMKDYQRNELCMKRTISTPSRVKDHAPLTWFPGPLDARADNKSSITFSFVSSISALLFCLSFWAFLRSSRSWTNDNFTPEKRPKISNRGLRVPCELFRRRFWPFLDVVSSLPVACAPHFHALRLDSLVGIDLLLGKILKKIESTNFTRNLPSIGFLLLSKQR